MVQSTLELLPYEFARVNRVLLQSDQANLLLAPDAPDWAIAEVSRVAGSKLTVSRVGDEAFDAMLSQVYSGRQGSSEAVMEDIKDFVDLESAAAEIEEAGDLLDAENEYSRAAISHRIAEVDLLLAQARLLTLMSTLQAQILEAGQ